MAAISTEERATRAFSCTPNADGEVEQLAGVSLTHRFVAAPGAIGPLTWHVVEVGENAGEALVLIHGHPFSWAYWKPLIPQLAAARRVIAVDLKGYGQSDKRAGDWRSDRIAEELLALCETLNLSSFDLAAADRGTVICDHLVAAHPDRVTRYIRIGAPNENEVEGDHHYEEWHREPRWASEMLADAARYFVGVVEPQVRVALDIARWDELVGQFAYPRVGEAVARIFQESSFRKDRLDRRDRLFPSIRTATLDLRGSENIRYLPALPLGEPVAKQDWFERTIPKSGIYLVLEQPDAVGEAITDFLGRTPARTDGLRPTRASPTYVAAPVRVRSGVELVANRDGETETLRDVMVTHRFVETNGAVGPVRWHYVEAGDPSNETIVMLHGHPESWFGFRHQIIYFARNYHVLAPDLKGYGQSDKRPGDFRHENVSEEMLGLLDHLGIKKFSLIAHDRGAVQADYIAGNHPDRVLRYVRMQQIAHRLLPTNSPQERLFGDPIEGPKLFGDPKAIFDRMWGRFKMEPIDQAQLDRMISEVSHPGFAEAVPRYFQSSSFQKELYDRISRLFRNMRLPVLVLQAGEDVGQPRWYFDDPLRPLTDHLPNAGVEFIEGAGHFTTVNYPEAVTQSIARFFEATKVGV